MRRNRPLPLMLALAAACMLTACGGSSGGLPTDPGLPAPDPIVPSAPLYDGVVHDVTSDADRGPGSLRECLDLCTAGDRIAFDPSLAGATIELEQTLVIDCDVNIQGPPSGDLKLSGKGQVRVLLVEDGATAVIEDLWIQNGSETSAAGVRVDGAVLFLHCVTLHDNKVSVGTGRGGGLQLLNNASVILTDCTVQYCEAFNGAGIANDGGTLIARRCVFQDNATTGNSGGALVTQDVAWFENCLFCDNEANGGEGGAIFISGPDDPGEQGGEVTLIHCTLEWNDADDGAAISNSEGILRMFAVAIGPHNTLDPTTAADVLDDAGVLDVQYTYIANGSNGPILDGVDGNRAGTHAAPLDLGILGLADLGGHVAAFDLDPTSILIDVVPLAMSFDIDGHPLTEDSSGNPRPIGPAGDVGATEHDPLRRPMR